MKKVYVEEWKEYVDLYEREINQKQAISMVKRLKKHFDVPYTRIRFNKYQNASASNYELCFPNKDTISMGLIAHEVAHQFTYRKYGENMHHNKKFKKCMKMIINYCRKRNYWKEVYKDTTIDLKYRNNVENWVDGYNFYSAMRKARRESRNEDKELQRKESNLSVLGL